MTPPRILLITGAGRGIGAATARLAAERGYAVAVNYKSNEAAAHAVVSAIEASGGRAVPLQADIATESGVMGLFEQLDRTLGRLTALVNNAAVVDRQGPLSAVSEERLERVFATNVYGAFLCAREAVRRMSPAHGGTGGSIVNVSSMAARLGSPNEYVHYAASKAAVDTMTIGLAREVAMDRIRVNGVRPGPIHTTMHADGGEPNRIERVKSGIPMQRGGQPEEVARAVLWLLSDEASYITGTILDVAGGR